MLRYTTKRFKSLAVKVSLILVALQVFFVPVRVLAAEEEVDIYYSEIIHIGENKEPYLYEKTLEFSDKDIKLKYYRGAGEYIADNVKGIIIDDMIYYEDGSNEDINKWEEIFVDVIEILPKYYDSTLATSSNADYVFKIKDDSIIISSKFIKGLSLSIGTHKVGVIFDNKYSTISNNKVDLIIKKKKVEHTSGVISTASGSGSTSTKSYTTANKAINVIEPAPFNIQDTNGVWEKQGNSWVFKWPNGSIATSQWIVKNNKYYYVDDKGLMVTGWKKIGNDYYYFVEEESSTLGVGAAFTGWYYDKSDNNWYYLDKSTCKMVTGWVQIDSQYYYFEDSDNTDKPYGSMYSNRTTPDGYFVDNYGRWAR